MRAWMIPLLLLAGCDDTLFGVDSAAQTDTGPLATGHAGVVAIFGEDCVSCHPAGGAGSGQLDLESDLCATIVDVDATGYSGKVVAAGDSANSVLWHKMADTGTYGGKMPLGGVLSQEEVDIVANWIDDGATCD